MLIVIIIILDNITTCFQPIQQQPSGRIMFSEIRNFPVVLFFAIVIDTHLIDTLNDGLMT